MEKLQRKYTQEINYNIKSEKSDGDEKIYKEAHNAVQNLIPKKKWTYFKGKLKQNGKSKKTLENIEITRSAKKVIVPWCLSESRRRANISLFHNLSIILKTLSNLANNLVLVVAGKFDVQSLENYYNNMWLVAGKGINRC